MVKKLFAVAIFTISIVSAAVLQQSSTAKLDGPGIGITQAPPPPPPGGGGN